MKRTILMFSIVCMLVISISSTSIASEQPQDLTQSIAPQRLDKQSQPYINAINNLPSTPHQPQVTITQPPQLAGEHQVFGLWIHINYNGEEFSKQVDITRQMIQGKLTDPLYRTPIRFNIDDDPEDDIEAGFGFFRYGIDDGDTVHSAFANAFDFRQINNGVDLPYSHLEVWQEFHINLASLKAKGQATPQNSFPLITTLLTNLKNRIAARTQFSILIDLIDQFLNIKTESDPHPLYAEEDYFVTRIGYTSLPGEKIPQRFEKTFAVAKDNIFRPFIFQHEMNSCDITGTAANTIGFGFQVFKAGRDLPTYDIGFEVDFTPAVHAITQFTPRLGEVRYYYQSASAEQTDITFSSLVNKGGDTNEEKEGTLALTLSLDAIPTELTGVGKYMSFDLDVIDDYNLLGGQFTYEASNEFNLGMIINAERFEEKVEVIKMPTYANLAWDVNFDISNTDGFMQFDAEGFVELDMSSDLSNIIVYYPKTAPTDPDHQFLNVGGIPQKEKIGAEGTLFLNPTNFSHPDNYVYGKAYRDYSDVLQSIIVSLPNITVPLVEVTEIPSYSAAQGHLNWNKLQGYAKAERWSSGPPDPISFNLAIETFTLNNVLEIPDGFVQGDFKLAEDGYLGFDTSDEMVGNTISITDTATGTSLSISADAVSADALWVDWGIDTSGSQIKVEDLFFTGALNSFKNFEISMTLAGKNGYFQGDWNMRDSGNFEIDFTQNNDVTLDFDMDDQSDEYNLHGSIELSNNLHFDMSWDWKQGSSYLEPGYFKINKNTNDPNIKSVNLYFDHTPNGSQTPQYGVNLTISALSVYLSCEWYKQSGHILPYIWLQYAISGDLDLHLLWNGDWYLNVEEWPQ